MAQLPRCSWHTNIIHTDTLPPQGHTLVMSACGKGNDGGDPALATDACEGARGNGNSKGGPTLVMDTRCDDNTEMAMFGGLPLWGR